VFVWEDSSKDVVISKTERKFTVGFRNIPDIGQLKYFPNLKMHLQNSTAFAGNLTSHQEIYEEFSNFVTAANVNFTKIFLHFVKWRQPTFSYFSRSSQI